MNNDTLDFTGNRRYAGIKTPVKTRQMPVKTGFTPQPTLRPLEEHFENFTDVVGEEAEYFFKKIRQNISRIIDRRAQIKDKKKLAKADKIQAQADAARIAANADAQARIIEAQAAAAAQQQAAAQQAAATQQLAASVNPGAPPVTPAQTPMYQTLQDNMMQGVNNGNWQDIVEPEPAANVIKNAMPEKTQTESATQPTAKKSKTTMYIVIALVVIAGIYFFMKNKKK